LGEVVPIFVAGVTGAYELIAYGVILIIVLLFLPRGLISIFGKVLSKRRAVVE
jgi:ABC-type branched-subunit amino acid transport system permease subunit